MKSNELNSTYDAAVIGSGQGGTPLAVYMAEQGLKTALIEREHVGGTCVNEGCTPTKTMIASGRVAHLARRSGDYGVNTGKVEVDFSRVRERKREIVESFRQGNLERIKGTKGLDLIRGEASFDGPRTLEVRQGEDEGFIEARKIFIDTGARPAAPPIEGLHEVDYLDSTSIMELEETPDKLLIIGGGYIGVEFGQAFRRFGSEVTIFQRSSQLLTHEDRDVAEAVSSVLEEAGLDVRLGYEVRSVEKIPGGIKVIAGDSAEETGSHLLAATGRAPNTNSLGLGATGVNTNERGFIEVDDNLETDQEGVYALGDVKGGPAFTHISYDDFRILRDNLFEGGDRTAKERSVPYTVFTDPQLGRVGLTEEAAREEGYDVRVAKMGMDEVARALEVDETLGLMKAVVDGETGEILGASVLGIEGGEIASAIQIAMMGDLTYKDLREGVFSHPTLAESLNNLFAKLD
ncbi:MAG: mercuric reductase [Candidatus Bipolaricaulota bacterium]